MKIGSMTISEAAVLDAIAYSNSGDIRHYGVAIGKEMLDAYLVKLRPEPDCWHVFLRFDADGQWPWLLYYSPEDWSLAAPMNRAARIARFADAEPGPNDAIDDEAIIAKAVVWYFNQTEMRSSCNRQPAPKCVGASVAVGGHAEDKASIRSGRRDLPDIKDETDDEEEFLRGKAIGNAWVAGLLYAMGYEGKLVEGGDLDRLALDIINSLPGFDERDLSPRLLAGVTHALGEAHGAGIIYMSGERAH